jgi:UDP-N-acetylmuramoylalanine--D-glutamate ligase
LGLEIGRNYENSLIFLVLYQSNYSRRERVKEVAVVGLGKTGLSACRYLRQKGFSVWMTDDCLAQSSLSNNLQHVPTSVIEQMIEERRFSFLLISPGVSISHPLVRKAHQGGIEVFCDVEYALRELQNEVVPISGITGTNGKTTTTLLTAFMMNRAGVLSKTVGNIGVPFLDEIGRDTDIHYVLELSSFQLQTLSTPRLQAAVLLNISPNHLDHHTSLEEYVKAKQHIGTIVNEDGVLFVEEKTFQAHSWDYVKCRIVRFGCTSNSDIFSDGESIYRFGVREEAVPAALRGVLSHDTKNFLAAYSLCRHYGVSPKQCVDAYAHFCKPPHRLQFLKTVGGVAFYDDSKATNVEAVIKAVESLESNILLIAGGVHKGYPYHAWKSAFEGRVKELFLIGQAATFIEQDIAGSVPTRRYASFEEAVRGAAFAAKPGDKVVLSPGCSSFDMFSCFEERGQKFQELVHQL